MARFGIDHLHLRSADASAAAWFFVDNFGAREVNRLVVRGKTRLVVAIDALEIFIEEENAALPTPPAPPFRGIEHLGLAVDDLDETVRQLAHNDVALAGPVEQVKPGVRIAFLHGPDGILIELIERRPA
ncbi:VOC family protein (plasmid) [Lichenicola cladoniae]|uniref:VOC family protein n=1 Tax=Lichenicola cladoniae TaxID=1484109 RepID=A0A6M8HX03_9PROT|nr:VOC family protein [Lichenicola cladoniae]NPD68681.1 VOC family protein [Acetobacteraceae bacterium]QKE93063.1 VOC family protein [Lichenicola cladoniae]